MKQEGTIRLEKMSRKEESILWGYGAGVSALPNILVEKFLKEVTELHLTLPETSPVRAKYYRHGLQLP